MWVMKAGCPSGNESNAVMILTKPDLAAKRADEILDLLRVMGERRHRPPDRTRPGGVAAATRDDMDVKLRHQIAQGCDVQLVAFGDLFQRARDPGNFRHQLRLLNLLEVDNLARLVPAR